MVSVAPKIGGQAGQTGWRFDGRNAHAVAFAERAAARYVTRVSDETRSAIQNLIVRSIQDGVTARDTAKLIQSTVGLTSQGTAAVKNYYQSLIARGDKPQRAWELTNKYSDKLLKLRAKTIARTEIMGALNAGALEQARQRAEAGIYKNPQKKWMITRDEVTCPKCRPMEGQVQPLLSPFSNGVMMPPAHPNCRCAPTFFDIPKKL
jgi:SPP1 gp7 family putative phage head morphogenesis protein